MANGVLTPLQMIAGAGLLQNQGIIVNPQLQTALNTYNNLPLIQPLIQTIQQGGNVLQPSTLAALQSIGATTVPGLSNSVPAGISLTPTNATPGLTGIIINTAIQELCVGDVSKFVQALNTAQGYIQFTDQFVTSAVNSQTYLANTFTNMNNMITGDITEVTTDSVAFGEDLLNLGKIINLQALNDLGSPALLLYNIVSQIGTVPDIQVALLNEGINPSVVLTLNDPRATVSDTVQRLMYMAMTKITGVPLTNILSALQVTTEGITTMADLLNPIKLFPNSYLSLQVITVEGEQPIYSGTNAVNTNLENLLPPYYMSSIV